MSSTNSDDEHDSKQISCAPIMEDVETGVTDTGVDDDKQTVSITATSNQSASTPPLPPNRLTPQFRVVRMKSVRFLGTLESGADHERASTTPKALLRISNKMDIESHAKGTSREFLVQDVTNANHKVAGGGTDEFVSSNAADHNNTTGTGYSGNNNGSSMSVKDVKQYRLTSRRIYTRFSRTWLMSFVMVKLNKEDIWRKRYSFHNVVTRYLNWTFRTSFAEVLLVSCLAFWFFCMIFAVAFFGFAKAAPECLQFNAPENETIANVDAFLDSFHLSWTTFSTVGYGIVFPQPSSDKSGCVMINLFTSFESFVGVIFSGFVGAIIFGKITRAQSHANVIYSDPIVVKYGTGVMPQDDDDDDDDCDHEEENNGNSCTKKNTDSPTPIPFPVLEFRILNGLYRSDGGEIVDASVNVSAVQKASKVALPIKEAADPTKLKSLMRKSLVQAKKATNVSLGLSPKSSAKKEKKSTSQHSVQHSIQKTAAVAFSKVRNIATSNLNATSTTEEMKRLEFELENNSVSFLESTKSPTAHDEDPSGNLIPPRIFSHLQVEPPSHPFFKRVWVVRHVLDGQSPLLTNKARAILKQETQDASWPPSLNHYQGVRESIHFDQLVVSMSGTANSSSSTVYGQKIYEFCDVNIGYAFANVLRKVGDGLNGELTVDASLLNDVVQQRGGGAEPFVNVVNDVDLEDLVSPEVNIAEADPLAIVDPRTESNKKGDDNDDDYHCVADDHFSIEPVDEQNFKNLTKVE